MPVKKINPKKAPVKLTSNAKPALKHTADDFIKKLNTYQSNTELEKIKRYFKTEDGDYAQGDVFIEAGDFFDANAGRGDDLVAGDDGADVNFAEGDFDAEFAEDAEKVFGVPAVFVLGVGDVGFHRLAKE